MIGAARKYERNIRDRIASKEEKALDALILGNLTFLAKMLYASDFSPTPKSPSSLVARLLRKGDTFVDGGANIGQISRLASFCVGNTGKVHAFEPSPELARKFRNIVSTCQLDNIEVHEIALGETDGQTTLHVASNGVSSSINDNHLPSLGLGEEETVSVQLSRLDSIFLDQKIDLIKLDLEGAELDCLKGAQNILDRGKLSPAIVCETFYEDLSKDIIDYMLERRYLAFSVDKGFPIIRHSGEFISGEHFDVLFIMQDSDMHMRSREVMGII